MIYVTFFFRGCQGFFQISLQKVLEVPVNVGEEEKGKV
jgi:hypothetical protein